MNTIVPALTSILIALALTGGAAGTPPEIELPGQPAPTGGPSGQAVGCELVGDGNVFGYGQVGVPSSEDGGCADFSARFGGPVLYTAIKNPERNGYTSLWSNDGGWAERFVNCAQPAILLVDWTTDPPSEIYLQGEDCFIYESPGDVSQDSWATYGGGTAGVKFVHTDNLADALVHLLL